MCANGSIQVSNGIFFRMFILWTVIWIPLHHFGVKNDGAGLDYFISKEDVINDSDLPTPHQLGFVGVVIGAALNTKKYPFHHLKRICELLDHPIVLLGGLEDADEGDRIAASDKIKIYNACGKFGLNESADLVRRAKLVVTNDTGLMHVAAAYKRPLISLWGNTVPAFGMYPYYGSKFLQAQEPERMNFHTTS